MRKRFVITRSRRRTGQGLDRYGLLAARKALARSAFRDATGIFQSRSMRSTSCPARSSGNSRRSICASRPGLHWRRLEASSNGSVLVATRRRGPKRSVMSSGGLLRSSTKAVALNFYGAPFDAITASEQAVALANTLGATAWLGYAEYVLGQAYFIAGRYRDAERLFNQSCARLTSAPGKRPAGHHRLEPSRALPHDEGTGLRIARRIR